MMTKYLDFKNVSFLDVVEEVLKNDKFKDRTRRQVCKFSSCYFNIFSIIFVLFLLHYFYSYIIFVV